MNLLDREKSKFCMAAFALTMLAVTMFAGAVVPAQAQTVAFPEATTFLSAPALDTTSSTVAVATGDFNGDGKLDIVNLDRLPSQRDLGQWRRYVPNAHHTQYLGLQFFPGSDRRG